MVFPKYAFVDFDDREIAPLCDSHREQTWHRWTSKIEKMVSVIFPIRSKHDYVALLILQRTQIAKLL